MPSSSRAAKPESAPLHSKPSIEPSPPRNAIVMVIDRFPANQITAYGNTYFETENLNRLAAESLLFEQVITPSAGLETAYESLLANVSWMEEAKRADVKTSFVTDDASLADHPQFDIFDEVMSIDFRPSRSLAKSEAATEMAQFFAAANRWLAKAFSPKSESADQRKIVWLHCRGLSSAWDAPYSLRKMLADEDDPAPPKFWDSPKGHVDSNHDDPDTLLGFQQAVAAQVAMLDSFLGIILDQLDGPEFANTAFCLLSTRGYPLGEHGTVGGVSESDFSTDDSSDAKLDHFNGQCFGESVHVPLLIRFSGSKFSDQTRMVRSHCLIEPKEALPAIGHFVSGEDAALDAWMERFVYSLPNREREYVVSEYEDDVAVQTHAWKLILQKSTGQTRLYAKPDDRWEVNDVSRRCPQIVESMMRLLQEHGKANPAESLVIPVELSESR